MVSGQFYIRQHYSRLGFVRIQLKKLCLRTIQFLLFIRQNILLFSSPCLLTDSSDSPTFVYNNMQRENALRKYVFIEEKLFFRQRVSKIMYCQKTNIALAVCQAKIKIFFTQILTYSAFANSCPLQTDTFLFPLIHSHNVKFASNKFQQCNERLGR